MLQASPYLATSRRVTLGPLPPIRMGSRFWRGRVVDHVRGVVVAAGGSRPLPVEHAADDGQRLGQPAQPLRRPVAVFDAEGRVLRLEPGRADAEVGAPAADVVQRGDHLGHQRRVAERVGADHQPDAGALRLRRHRRPWPRTPRASARCGRPGWGRGGPRSRGSRSRGGRLAAGPPGRPASRCTGSSS